MWRGLCGWFPVFSSNQKGLVLRHHQKTWLFAAESRELPVINNNGTIYFFLLERFTRLSYLLLLLRHATFTSHRMNSLFLLLLHLLEFSHSAPDRDTHLHVSLPPEGGHIPHIRRYSQLGRGATGRGPSKAPHNKRLAFRMDGQGDSFLFASFSMRNSHLFLEREKDKHWWTLFGLRFRVSISYTELQNVKYFTRRKIFRPNFTPIKARKSQQFLHF